MRYLPRHRPTTKRLRTGLALLAALCCCGASQALAEVQITIVNGDDDGEGLNDPTPVTPIGGNTGTTLGQQRLLAVQYAAELWGNELESDVPIVIAVNFEELGCEGNSAVLASAAPTFAFDQVTTQWADPNTIYASALADRLLGQDAAPGEADIVATFNASIDTECNDIFQWYYGLDAQGEETDLVQTALHEFAHGLGMIMLVNSGDGSLAVTTDEGSVDPLTARAFDRQLGLTMDNMSDAQRLQALSEARQVVFLGEQTRAASAQFLERGTPSLTFDPAVPGYSGHISDSNLGTLGGRSLAGPIIVPENPDGCSAIEGATDAFVFMVPTCNPLDVAELLAEDGALGILLVLGSFDQTPPIPLDLPGSFDGAPLPVLTLSLSDAQALVIALNSGEVNAQLDIAQEQPRGVGPNGYLLLNASDPISTSVLSHWDSLARPNLLMEAFEGPAEDVHGLDVTVAALNDLGWAAPCGDGILNDGEICDDGDNNSNTVANACRTNCIPAFCGDGVLDTSEICDDGADNGTLAGTCNSACSGYLSEDAINDKNVASGNNNTAGSANSGSGGFDLGTGSADGTGDNTELSSGGSTGGCRVGDASSSAGAGSSLLILGALYVLRTRRRRYPQTTGQASNT